MIDKKKICGIYLHEISSHTVQNFMDCIKKLLDKMEDDRLENPYYQKNQKALQLLDELLDQDTAYFISFNKFQLLQKITEIKKILTQES